MLDNDADGEKDGGYVHGEFGNGDVFPFRQHVGGSGRVGRVIWLWKSEREKRYR